MTIKNMLGGALINYGDAFPTASTAPDGALFLKTGGGGEGLYIYRLIRDTNPGAIGNQAGAGWTSIVSTGSGVNADTLDGFDSTYFQPAAADLTGLSSIPGVGLVTRLGSGSFTTRGLVAGTAIVIGNSDGTAGNINVSVVPSAIDINGVSGILSATKGGTGTGTIPPGGAVIYSTGAAYSSTVVGSVGQLLQSNSGGAPSWVSPSSLSVGSATNAATANQASNANALNGVTADTNPTPSTIVQRDGSADVWARLVRTTFTDEGSISGGLVFRVNNSSDNYLRVCNNTSAIRSFLDVPQATGAGASGTWTINITGNANSANSATTATSANTANSATTAGSANTLTTSRAFNVTGPSGSPSLLTTEGSVGFNGGGDVVLRINSVDASLLGGTVANARISGAYTGFTSITVSGTASVGALSTSGAISTPSTISASGTISAGGFSTTGASSLGSTQVTGTLSVIGNITATGNITAFSLSDSRLKSDIRYITDGLQSVLKMRGVNYLLDTTGRREVGLIAQELLEVVPEAVREGSDGYYGVQYGHLVGVLVEAIKEQQEMISRLQADVADLKRTS